MLAEPRTHFVLSTDEHDFTDSFATPLGIRVIRAISG